MKDTNRANGTLEGSEDVRERFGNEFNCSSTSNQNIIYE